MATFGSDTFGSGDFGGGTPAVVVEVSTTIDGDTDVSADLIVSFELDAAIDGDTDVVADFTVSLALTTTIDGDADITVDLTGSLALTAVIDGDTDVVADSTSPLAVEIAALIDGDAEVAADLTFPTAYALTAGIDGAGAVDAFADLEQPMLIHGNSAVVAQIEMDLQFAAIVDGIGELLDFDAATVFAEVVIDGSGTVVVDPTTFTLRPPNDAMADATVLSETATGSVAGANAGATSELGEPRYYTHEQYAWRIPSLSPQATVWWVWTAPYDGNVNFTISGYTVDLVLGVFRGTLLAEADTFSGDSTASTWVDAGAVYYLRVGGRTAANVGAFTLAWVYVVHVPVGSGPLLPPALGADPDWFPVTGGERPGAGSFM